MATSTIYSSCLTLLMCTCWKGVPESPSEIRGYSCKFCVYVPLPYELVCSTSTIHRVQGELKTYLYPLKIQLQAYSPVLVCYQRISKPRVRLRVSLIKMQLVSGAGQNISVNIVSTSSQNQVLLMNCNRIMNKEVIIH